MPATTMGAIARRSLSIVTLAGVSVLAASVLSAGAALKATAPHNTTPPAISGTPTQGQTLTSSTGTWNGTTPITYAYSWRRCDATGGSCAQISGATASTYALTNADVGATVRVRVTASNSAGSTGSTSVPSAVIASGTTTTTTTTTTPAPPATGCPSGTGTVNVSQVSLPARLLINSVSSTPSVIGKSVQSFTLKVLIGNTCNQAVQGALVYVTAVPYNMFAIPPEVATDSTGVATLTMDRLKGFPVSSKQTSLVLFIRARKDGENLLAGISSRRLVSLQVNQKA
jgi:hypothetical protein